MLDVGCWPAPYCAPAPVITNIQHPTSNILRRMGYTPERVSSGSLPVLPPSRWTGASSLSIGVTSRFAIVGLPEYFRCRPPLMRPAPPPARSRGRLSPECLVLFEMPEP